MSGTGSAWLIRPMRFGDLEAIASIERDLFPNPWPAGAFLSEIEAPHARCEVLCPVRGPATIAGYICYWILPGELLINNLAIRRDCQRSGGGGRLLDHALRLGALSGCRVAYLEVRPSNLAARSLYETRGFRVVHRRPAYYRDTREDALIMEVALKGLETG